jgi:hypothetical protein
MKIVVRILIERAVLLLTATAMIGMVATAHSQSTHPDTPEWREWDRRQACFDGYNSLSESAGLLSELAETDAARGYYTDAERELAYAMGIVNEWQPVDLAERLCAQPRLDGLAKIAADWRRRVDALVEARDRKRQQDLDAMIEELLAHGLER